MDKNSRRILQTCPKVIIPGRMIRTCSKVPKPHHDQCDSGHRNRTLWRNWKRKETMNERIHSPFLACILYYIILDRVLKKYIIDKKRINPICHYVWIAQISIFRFLSWKMAVCGHFFDIQRICIQGGNDLWTFYPCISEVNSLFVNEKNIFLEHPTV